MSVQWNDSDYQTPSETVDRVLKGRAHVRYNRAPYHEYITDKHGYVHATERDLLSATVERFGRALRPTNRWSGVWIMALASMLALALYGGIELVRGLHTGVWL